MVFMVPRPRPLANTLGVYPSSSMTARTLERVFWLTLGLPLRTLDTVAMETPARLETS